VVAATGAICLVYLVDIACRLLRQAFAFLHDSSWLSIGISRFVVVIAALNLVLDFDFIERGVEQARRSTWSGTPPSA
jgi:uncharacterized YccA/Bax inhibitor family protein